MITEFAVKQGIISKFLSLDFHRLNTGAIHSVFNSSFNIAIDRRLVHIDSTERPLSAFGINIPPDLLDKLLGSIAAGDLVRIKDNDFIIFAPKANLVKINFQNFVYKNLKLSQELGIPAVLRENYLVKRVTEVNYGGHIGFPYGKREVELIEKLKTDSSLEFIGKFAKHFIGRGKGLTPGGDDFIIGYMMILYMLRREEFDRWKLVVPKLLSQIKTTDVSLNYYRAMFEGYVSEQFHEFSRNLFYELDEMKAQGFIDNILAYGSSSGYDTLLGIYIALDRIIFEEASL